MTQKNLPANTGGTRDTGLIPGLKRSLEKEMATTPVFLPGKSHGQRSLAGYIVHAQSDMPEHTDTMYVFWGGHANHFLVAIVP